ncbi:MAG: AMP-binding protein, partial [Rhizobiales bacterium]|nr:AMP-binding protein [Hyphomicrobiales bacterium]
MQGFCLGDVFTETGHAERAALVSSRRTWTYSQLRDDIATRAGWIASLGLKRGDTVGIDQSDSQEALLLALALTWLGCRWFRKTNETYASQTLFYSHILSDRAASEPPQGRHLQLGPMPRAIATPIYRPAHRFAGNEIVLFGESSGSTGTPKILPMTAAQLDRRADPRLLLDDSAVPRVTSAFNPLHIVSFYNFLRVLRRGGTYALGIRSPGVTHMLLAPGMIERIIEDGVVSQQARIRSCWIGGGPLYPPSARLLLSYFEKVIYTYGSQEAGNAAYRTISTENDVGEAGDVGQVAEGVELRIVDGNDRIVPPGSEGEICYRTASVISGYIGDSERGNSQFAGGFFFPGDIGRLDGDGRLTVTGRVTEQLNIGGIKISAARIDEAVTSVEGVGDASSTTIVADAGVERLVVGYHVAGSAPADPGAAIRDRLMAEFGTIGKTAIIFALPLVPRNENGKLDRRKLAELA